MKLKSNLSLILVVSALIVSGSCGSDKSNKNAKQEIEPEAEDYVLTVDTFSTFPPEIDGCSCYFSNDSLEFKQGKYIYMSDFDKTSFLKINNDLVKFTKTSREEIDSLNVKETYKSEGFELTIQIKQLTKNGYETWLNTGTITLSDKKGNTLTKSFYGECGC